MKACLLQWQILGPLGRCGKMAEYLLKCQVIIKNLSESLRQKMSCQELTMRKLLNQKYEQYAPNLNPFSNILFCENWSWPQMHIPQTLGPKTKNVPSKASSVKADIVGWFSSLSYSQKCATTMIKNQHFLTHFLQTHHEWNPSMLYHIYQHRKIPNYLAKNTDPDTMKQILAYLSIAWLDEPLLYFNVDQLEGESFFALFLAWMDRVSNNKVFEYAHKIKNKADPQENLLWFTEKSFQSLEAWIINQFQKVIIKNYYNKNNYDLENYSKILKLRSGLTTNWNNSYGCKKEIESLLCTKINETKNKSESDYKEYQHKVKIYEDHYYEQIALLLEYEKDEANGEGNREEVKKKKKRSKKRNKKKNAGHEGEAEGDKNGEGEEMEKNQGEEVKQTMVTSLEYLKDSEQCNNIENVQMTAQRSLQSLEETALVANMSKETPSTQPLNSSPQPQQTPKNPQPQKSQSQNSADWSNVQTTKTTKKSGHSHPEFNQIDRINHIKAKRSLSPQENNNSISKLKKKQRGERRKANQISSWNGDEEMNQGYLESCEYKFSNKEELEPEVEQSQKQVSSKQQTASNPNDKDQLTNPNPQKKKKKKPKTLSLLKQLSGKVSTSLLNRQLNNFIDSLSIETNNLYDHKIISFERVRFFIQSLFPASQAILFGSNAVGLSLPTSDIDIMLYNLPCSCREEAIEILAHLAVQINTMGWIVSCSTYLNAKVPLVKLQIDPTIEYTKTKRKCDYHIGQLLDPRIIQHLQLKTKPQKQPKPSSSSNLSQPLPQNSIIKVDLTINITQESILGGQSTQLMKQWMNRYPQIHVCILAFKYILVQRGFSSNFRGGIGSYCLFVMVAAYIREFPELEAMEDGEFFLSTLKFYGEQFQNQIKSIILRPFQQPSYCPLQTCFISLEQTLNLIHHQASLCYSPEDPALLYNIQTNPLRIFDPINNKIMSGSCHLYPQIKAQFRRIYKELQSMKEIVQREVELTVMGAEVGKMLENRKTMEKWLNKYESRNRVSVKDVLDGGF